MKDIIKYPILVAMIVSQTGCLNERPVDPTNPVVQLRTEVGMIEVEVFLDKAPITARNFMRYVRENRFANASFYRVVTIDNQPDRPTKIEVIQGGIGFVESEKRLDPIAHEPTSVTGLKHLDGSVSMARREPGTASSEFFICIGAQPELDFGSKRNPDGQGYAVFGQVRQGMDVVRMIQGLPADGQMLIDPVRITEVK